MKLTVLARISSIFFIIMFSLALELLAQPEKGRGLKEITLEEIQNLQTTAKPSDQIRVSVLGLKRINQKLIQRKKTSLPVITLQNNQKYKKKLTNKSSEAESTIYFLKDFSTDDLPAQIDNSESNFFPPIGDQGIENSCVAWATTYYILTYEVARVKLWDIQNTSNANHFSPRWTYNLINSGIDQGISLADAIGLLEHNGAAKWQDFSWPNTNVKEWPNNPLTWQKAINFKIKNFWLTSVLENIVELKGHLNSGAIGVFGTYIDSWQYTEITEGEYAGQSACYYVAKGLEGGHAMVCVGYNDNIWIDINRNNEQDEGELGALKIANSWGKNWAKGQAGFVWLAYDALNSYTKVAPVSQTQPYYANRQPAMLASANHVLGFFYEEYTPKILAQIKLKAAYRGDIELVFSRETDQEYFTQIFKPGEGTYGPWGFDGKDYSNNLAAAPSYTLVFDITNIIDFTVNKTSYGIKVRDRDEHDQHRASQILLSEYTLLDGQTSQILSINTNTIIADNAGKSLWLAYPWQPPATATITATKLVEEVTATPTSPATLTATSTIAITPDKLINNIQVIFKNNLIRASMDKLEISLLVPTPQQVVIKVYTLSGKYVTTLVEEKVEKHREISWQGLNQKGNKLSSGVYIIHTEGSNFSDTQKIVIVK